MYQKKPYREYRTITREQAFSRGFDYIYLVGGYEARRARQLMALYPDVQRIDFCDPQHNTPRTRYRPIDGITAVYVRSRYGRKTRFNMVPKQLSVSGH